MSESCKLGIFIYLSISNDIIKYIMFTKTEIAVLKLFCANLTKYYTIRGIAKEIKKSFPIVHKSVRNLIIRKILLKNEYHLINLNPEKYQEPAFIENLRAQEFLEKHASIKLFKEETIKQMDEFFVLIIFGSYAVNQQSKNSDIDMLMIINKNEDCEKQERFLYNIAEIYLKKAHCLVVSREGVKEMLRDKKLNVLNETLNKHILLWGAEEYYLLIKDR